MNQNNKAILLSEHLRNYSHNFKVFMKYFPKIYIAAEYINDLLDQLFTERLVHDNKILWQSAVSTMLFGVHMSWIQGFIHNASSLSDIGLMADRKAVEYVCYISKIYQSDEKAKLWYEKNKDLQAAKEFSYQFQIPQSYFKKKYSHIRPLLVYYDYSSTYGTHANLGSLISKKRDIEERCYTVMSFQDDSETTASRSVMSVQLGSFIIDSLMSVLQNNIWDFPEFKKRTSMKKEMIRDARLEAITFLNEDKDFGIVKSINEDDMSGIEGLYKELKEKYSGKESKNNISI